MVRVLVSARRKLVEDQLNRLWARVHVACFDSLVDVECERCDVLFTCLLAE